ncbi:hypothetical protein U91I_00737 [alpha proteobacterium U9-1i]|nr:hypothetical protein U91I_00737 [alpha proteobacterium U9-1i]
MGEPVIYRRRANRVSRGEREWRVEDDALVTRGDSGNVRRTKWSEIVSVRLYHEPTASKPFRYLFALKPRDKVTILIDNAHYLGPGQFEDRSDTYTPFVRAALARVALKSPKAMALMGETPKRYFFLLLLSLFGLCGVAYVLVAVPTPLDGLSYAPLIKFGIVSAMLPLFWLWVLRAMPRGVPLDDIPDRALPPVPRPD